MKAILFSQHFLLSGDVESRFKYYTINKFKVEIASMCCMMGKVKLPSLEVPSPQPFTYVNEAKPESKHFLQNMRRYNCYFQITSFGATSICNEGGFSPVFKIQRQIYGRIGSLLPLPDETSKFFQIYFMGNEQLKMDQRCTHIQELKKDIIQELERLLLNHNQLINVFRTSLKKWLQITTRSLFGQRKSQPVNTNESLMHLK